MKIKHSKTHRGFTIIEFRDRYDHESSIQNSSLATESAIWFGINDPKPEIMASKASAHGIKTDETTGWVPFPIPDDVIIHTRMHLTQKQVKELLPFLQYFAENGELPEPKKVNKK